MYGMRRSGNHAIASWLQRNAPQGKALFLNNCRRGATPLKSFSAIEVNGQSSNHSLARENFVSFGQGIGDGGLFLVSYEDSTISFDRDDRPMSRDVPPTFFDHELMVVRSFLNWMASLIKKLELNPELTTVRRIATALRAADVYRQLLADIDRRDVISVCYDRWCSDEEYRAALLAQLGLAVQDNSLGEVTSYGGGSSFQKTTQSAQELQTDSRWRQMRDHAVFKATIDAAAQDPVLIAAIGEKYPFDAAVLTDVAAGVSLAERATT